MILSLALCVVGLQDPETYDLRWPMGSGDKAFPLHATYGQFLGNVGSPAVHFGIDVIAKKDGEPVYAIEAGTVRRVQLVGADTGTGADCTEDVEAYRCGVLISNEHRRAFYYIHLQEESIEVVEGQTVVPGTYLGQVVYDDPETCVEHLHLSRVGGAYIEACWADVEELSVRNPLKLLKPEYLHDDVAPRLKTVVSGKKYVFRQDEPGAAYLSGNLPKGPLDLVVRPLDRDASGSTVKLAPYRIVWSVDSSSDIGEEREWIFDGKLEGIEPAAIYNLYDPHGSVGDYAECKYTYYLIPTNAAPGGGAPSTSHSWQATTGHHAFVVTVFDVAGNSAELEFTVDIP